MFSSSTKDIGYDNFESVTDWLDSNKHSLKFYFVELQGQKPFLTKSTIPLPHIERATLQRVGGRNLTTMSRTDGSSDNWGKSCVHNPIPKYPKGTQQLITPLPTINRKRWCRDHNNMALSMGLSMHSNGKWLTHILQLVRCAKKGCNFCMIDYVFHCISTCQRHTNTKKIKIIFLLLPIPL